MSEPLVSVITIFLDEELFLEEAVESVLSQTFMRWELLLCDDGSSDGSTRIARAYAREYPGRIRYLTHPGGVNRGMSATRNLGLRHSRGDLVAILDADDVWLPRKLERQVEALERVPGAAMVVGRSLWWYSWTGRPEDASRDFESRPTAMPGRTTRGRTALARVLRDPERMPCTGTILARRDAMIAVDGFEDRFRGIYEDLVFLSKFLLHNDLLVIDECLDRYRQHPRSCRAVRERDLDGWRARRGEYLEWMRGYIADRTVGPVVRWEVMRESWTHRFPRLERVWDLARTLWGQFVTLGFAAARRVLPATFRSTVWRTVMIRNRDGPEAVSGPDGVTALGEPSGEAGHPTASTPTHRGSAP